MGMPEWVDKLKTMTQEEKLATVEVDSIGIYENAIVIRWSGIQGFGEYTIDFKKAKNEDGATVIEQITGDSEGMDIRNGQHIFLKQLLNKFADRVELSG